MYHRKKRFIFVSDLIITLHCYILYRCFIFATLVMYSN